MMRLLAVLAGTLVVWLVTATQVPSRARLPLDGVVVGAVVSQPFGCTSLELEPFDALCPSHHVHTGIDLAAPIGTEVHSAAAGSVVTGYEPSGAGNYVVVTVDPHVRILYCHLSAFRVRSGDAVTAGDVIGQVGETGLSTGPHVHLQVDVDGSAVDPASWLGP